MRPTPAVLLGSLLLAAGSRAGPPSAPDLAYLAREGGYWQAWVLELDSGARRRVTRSPGDKTRLSWYPGGRILLVATLAGGAVQVEVSTGREWAVLEDARCFGAVLSPGGRSIACSRAPEAGAADPYDHDLWVLAADGSDPRRLTQTRGMQHQPAWHPSGRWIYFASGSGGPTHDLWRVARDGARRERLSAGPRYRLDPALSPDGVLAYSSNRSGDYEIWVEREGSRPERLTDHPGLDGSPSWSPDGQRLAFERVDGGRPQVWVLEVGGAAEVEKAARGEAVEIVEDAEDTKNAEELDDDEGAEDVGNPVPVRVTSHPGGARAPVWRAGRAGAGG